jgi:nucleoside-diphosphate-sugar epimerase
VFGTTRSTDRWQKLHAFGVRTALLDINRWQGTVDLPDNWRCEPLDVYFMLPPSSLKQALEPGGGYDCLLKALATDVTHRAILVSSTAVFGDHLNDIVTAETLAQPRDERGLRLLDIEHRWLRLGPRFLVCRLAGLYGSRRIIGRKQLLDGAQITGDAGRWLNLIHAADAAQLLVACITGAKSRPIELGSDGNPVRRGEYYRHTAVVLGAPVPQFETGEAPGAGSRRCDPRSTMQRTGWRPRYADFRQGLAAIIACGDKP